MKQLIEQQKEDCQKCNSNNKPECRIQCPEFRSLYARHART